MSTKLKPWIQIVDGTWNNVAKCPHCHREFYKFLTVDGVITEGFCPACGKQVGI